MKESPISRITAPGLVEWTGTETKTTRKGKVKQVTCGIPTKAFWSLWKRVKASGENRDWRNAGILLVCHSRRKGTGEFRTFKGCKVEIKVSEWEVQIWQNKGNRPELAELGFPTDLPDLDALEPELVLDTTGENCPF